MTLAGPQLPPTKLARICSIRRVGALRNLQVAAELISAGPQTGTAVVKTLGSLAEHVERWRSLCLWQNLQFDALAEPHRLIGARQNASAALCGIAHELKLELRGIVELGSLVVARAPNCFVALG